MTLNLATLTLDKGAHDSPDDGMCVMEAVAFLAKESHSDHPACTSPVIGAFLRSLNDRWDDEKRQTLKPYIAKVIGTNTGPADDERRAWMATDWLVRTCAPGFLRAAHLNDQAALLEALPELVSGDTATAIEPTLTAVRQDANAARDAAWAAAGAAAWDAARDAAWAAAWAAAWDAAGDAARDAAWDAAWAAAWDAARDAAWAAAWAAAWDAAGDAARDAAWAAAWAALAPTVEALQPSIYALLDRMCEVGR